MSDLASLVMIEIESQCFENGDLHMSRAAGSRGSSLVLPKLNTFKCGENCFSKTVSLNLKSILCAKEAL